MNAILIVCAICCIATWFVEGFTVLTIMATVATVLFCSRKVGHFCKYNTLIALEGVGTFLTLVIQAVFDKFVLSRFLITVVLQVIFLAVAYYDTHTYVYVKEIRRKGESEVDE